MLPPRLTICSPFPPQCGIAPFLHPRLVTEDTPTVDFPPPPRSSFLLCCTTFLRVPPPFAIYRCPISQRRWTGDLPQVPHFSRQPPKVPPHTPASTALDWCPDTELAQCPWQISAVFFPVPMCDGFFEDAPNVSVRLLVPPSGFLKDFLAIVLLFFFPMIFCPCPSRTPSPHYPPFDRFPPFGDHTPRSPLRREL